MQSLSLDTGGRGEGSGTEEARLDSVLSVRGQFLFVFSDSKKRMW